MGKGDPHRGQQQPAPIIERVIVAPPADVEATPPPVANLVTVTGNADMLTVEFFYVHPNRISRMGVSSKKESDAALEPFEAGYTLRSLPVARVALPISIAGQVIVRLMQSVISGMPALVSNFMGMKDEIEQAVAKAVATAEQARGAGADPGSSGGSP